MAKYKYIIPNEDEDSAYLLYEVRDAATDKTIISFYTNRAREGRFYYTTDGTYRQTAGTCDFSMPREKAAARAKLRRMADERMNG
jgi:hypothetical protein